jgi:hypothetical protein
MERKCRGKDDNVWSHVGRMKVVCAAPEQTPIKHVDEAQDAGKIINLLLIYYFFNKINHVCFKMYVYFLILVI